MLGRMRESLLNTYWEVLSVLVGELLKVLRLRCVHESLLRLNLVVDHLGVLRYKL